MDVRTGIDILQNTVERWGEKNASRLAAALAYHTVFSLAPLLVIAISIAGLVFDPAQVQALVERQLQEVLQSPEGAAFIRELIAGVNQPFTGTVAGIFGVLSLMLGALGAFGELHGSLNFIWGVKARREGGILGVVRDRLLAFSLVLGVGLLLLVSLFASTALTALGGYLDGVFPGYHVLLQALNILLSLGLMTLLFALIFKVLPDVEIAWRDVWMGAFVTAVLFTIGKSALGIYLGGGGFSSTYGAAASLVLILLWVFYSAQILFFGAVFTQVYANQFGSFILPAEGAVRFAGGVAPIPYEERESLYTAAPRKRERTDLPADEHSPTGEWGPDRRLRVGRSARAVSALILALLAFTLGWLLRGLEKD
jgi:membrane protein